MKAVEDRCSVTSEFHQPVKADHQTQSIYFDISATQSEDVTILQMFYRCHIVPIVVENVLLLLSHTSVSLFEVCTFVSVGGRYPAATFTKHPPDPSKASTRPLIVWSRWMTAPRTWFISTENTLCVVKCCTNVQQHDVTHQTVDVAFVLSAVQHDGSCDCADCSFYCSDASTRPIRIQND